MLPLKGIRVLDLTTLSSYCGMELADYGAEVIKIEKPNGGDPLRILEPLKNGSSIHHAFRNRGKKSVTLDIWHPEGRTLFKKLVATSDAIIENYMPGTMEALGLAYEDLSVINPAIVYGRLTAYGSDTTENNILQSDIVAQAKSGVMHFTGFPENPPTRIGFSISERYSASFLSSAICIAIFHAKETGEGQIVETSLCGSAVAVSEDKVITYGATGEDPMRTGNAHPLINPYDILKCKNGYVAMGISSDDQWAKFCDAFDRKEWKTSEKYCSNLVRGYNYFGDLRIKIEELFAQYDMQEIASICDDALIPGTMCSTTAEALTEPQLHERNMIITIDDKAIGHIEMPGKPVKFAGEKEEEIRHAPSLGEHNTEIFGTMKTDYTDNKGTIKLNSQAKKRPLDGIKVLDFSQVLSAPFCGMLLGDLGAEVIKVERPGNGDISREYGPYVNDISLYYCQYNRGKKGLAVDLRSDDGKKIIMDLVPEMDIVIENYKSGTLEKLGLGYEEMIKLNPDLIYGSVAGFGTYGPLSHLPCMDIIAAARSGLVSQTGVDGEAPIKPGFSLCDTWAGLHLLRGLSMALLHRQKTGKGLRVDIAMLDCAFYMCEKPVLEHSITGEFIKRTGNHDNTFAPYGEFKTSDGNVVIAVSKEDQWHAFCEVLNLTDIYNDPRFSDNLSRVKNRRELVDEIEKVTSGMERYRIEKILTDVRVPAAAVQTLAEFAANKKTEKLNVITKINQPGVGEYVAVNTPILFSKTPVNPHGEAPSFPGSHSREILEKLGYSQKKITELINSGAVYQRD